MHPDQLAVKTFEVLARHESRLQAGIALANADAAEASAQAFDDFLGDLTADDRARMSHAAFVRLEAACVANATLHATLARARN